MTYTIQEGTLALQPGDDRSVNILTLERPEGGGAVHLVVSRDELLPGEDLAASVQRQLQLAARQMPAFKEVSRQAQRAGPADLPALVLEIQFKQGGQRIHQLQAALELPGARMLVFTLNSAAPVDAALRAYWQALLAGFVPTGFVPAAAT